MLLMSRNPTRSKEYEQYYHFKNRNSRGGTTFFFPLVVFGLSLGDEEVTPIDIAFLRDVESSFAVERACFFFRGLVAFNEESEESPMMSEGNSISSADAKASALALVLERTDE